MREIWRPAPVLSEAEGLTNKPETPYSRDGGNLMAENGVGENIKSKGFERAESSKKFQSPFTHSSESIRNPKLRQYIETFERKMQQKPITDWSIEELKTAYSESSRFVSSLEIDKEFSEREQIASDAQPLGNLFIKELERRGFDLIALKELFLRNQEQLRKEGFRKGGVGTPGPIGRTGIPAIDLEIDTMDNILDTKLRSPLNVYLETVINISRLTGVDEAKKKSTIDEIKKTIEKEYKESEKNRPAEEQERRYSLYFTPAEQDSLRKDPTEWLDTQFDVLYRFAEEGQELSSPIINGVQQQVSQAVDFVKNYRPEVMSEFLTQYTVRLHLLQERTAIGYRSMENVKQAAHELRFHGLMEGITLEKGMVGAMFNRFQDLLEEVRLPGNKRHHVMLEDAFRLPKKLIDEQMNLAKKGIGNFGNLNDIAIKSDKDQNPNDSNTWDDFTWATKMTDKQIKENKKISEEQKDRIMRIKSVEARITRSVRTAYDVFVCSQRMGVVVARGKYLLKDSSRYRSDPIGPLNVYNMEELLFEKFDMYNPQQEEMVDRIRLDYAESYLKDQKETQKGKYEDLTREQKLDLGKRLFRDLFAVPDFFSSGWRIEGVIQALEQRFETRTFHGKPLSQLLSPKEMNDYEKLKSDSEKRMFEAKKRAEDFALFMRLRATGQEQISSSGTEESREKTRKKREEIWGKIRDYRPEEIIRLFREREGNKLEDLYRSMVIVDSDLNLTAEEKIANRPEEEGGRGKDLTIYDKFKKKYGTIIGFLRQEGFNKTIGVEEKDVFAPEQINLAKLTKEQKETIDKLLGVGNGQKLTELAIKMQNFISSKGFVENLLTDNKFADIYTRSVIIDDALLDKLEDEKPGNGDNLGYVPLSKIIGEAGAGGDTLVRSWNDTENAVKGGNALIKFIKEENIEKKTNAALEFAASASSYNGLGPRGQAECVRYTIGTFLNLTKLDKAWDIIGLNSLPFRIPASEAQRIFGVQAGAIGRDELRLMLDQLNGFLNSSVTKAREKLQEDLKELEVSVKYDTPEKRADRKKELEAKFAKDQNDSHKFYKEMESILEVTGKDFLGRTGFRIIFFLMLSVLGEVYKVGESSFKDTSK